MKNLLISALVVLIGGVGIAKADKNGQINVKATVQPSVFLKIDGKKEVNLYGEQSDRSILFIPQFNMDFAIITFTSTHGGKVKKIKTGLSKFFGKDEYIHYMVNIIGRNVSLQDMVRSGNSTEQCMTIARGSGTFVASFNAVEKKTDVPQGKYEDIMTVTITAKT
ncbi:MAG: hypothetical protein LBH38_02210 [Holosporales bacterium]|jgi:hypothetical protein|nr:hypothetical protein [Holosporales bacterium]